MPVQQFCRLTRVEIASKVGWRGNLLPLRLLHCHFGWRRGRNVGRNRQAAARQFESKIGGRRDKQKRGQRRACKVVFPGNHVVAPYPVEDGALTVPPACSLGLARVFFFRFKSLHGGGKRTGACSLRRSGSWRIVPQSVEFVGHGQTASFLRRSFNRFRASCRCQDTVFSEQPITSAAAAWLRPSA
ncbi:hypothetical protein D3C80_790620 [compost metagenome]